MASIHNVLKLIETEKKRHYANSNRIDIGWPVVICGECFTFMTSGWISVKFGVRKSIWDSNNKKNTV